MPLRDQWPKCRHPQSTTPHPDGKWIHLPGMKTSFVRLWEIFFLRPGEEPSGPLGGEATKRWPVEKVNALWAAIQKDESPAGIAHFAQKHFPSWDRAKEPDIPPGEVFTCAWRRSVGV